MGCGNCNNTELEKKEVKQRPQAKVIIKANSMNITNQKSDKNMVEVESKPVTFDTEPNIKTFPKVHKNLSILPQNFYQKSKTFGIDNETDNLIAMNEKADLDLDSNEQIFPSRLRKSVSNSSNSNDRLINLSALFVDKYFKDQKPPKDKTSPWTDELFPPNLDSLLPKKMKMTSNLMKSIGKSINVEADGEDYLNKQLYKNFNFDKNSIAWYRAKDIFPEGRYTIFEDKVEVNDILQGNIGNCYFMSSLAAMCRNPQFIMELFRDLSLTSNGCYEVVMRIDGVWKVVLLDDYFPCHKESKKPLFAQSNGSELWVMLLEKAWAKVNGCYFNMISGWSSEVLFSLTSFPVYILDHKLIEKNELWKKLTNLLDKESIITCTSKLDESIEKMGLVHGHSFSVIGVKEGLVRNRTIKLIRLRNPWGYKEWTGRWSDKSKEWNDETRQVFNYRKTENKNDDDGEFYMEYYDYLRFFIVTEVCQVSKNVCSKSRIIDDFDGGSIFEIVVKDLSDLKIQAVKQSGRFEKKIPMEGELNMSLILLKKEVADGNINFSFLDSNTDCVFNPFINRVVDPGTYVVYIYADYTFSNFDQKRNYLLNVSSDNEFKVSKKAVDRDFTVLQEVISKSLIQLVATKEPLHCSNSIQLNKLMETKKELESSRAEKLEPLTSIIQNRFQDTSFGILYLKNNLKSKSISVTVTNNAKNMYLLNPKIKSKEFTLVISPLSDYCVIGIREKYYEEFCFDLPFTYKKVDLLNETCTEETYLSKVLGRRKSLIVEAISNKSPISPDKLNGKCKKKNYFDFVHYKHPVDLKHICSVINSKEAATDVYTLKYPEEMKELKTIPDLLDFEEVIFYDKIYVVTEKAHYFGEWKVKNSFIKHGRGMFIYDNGDKYVGQIQNGYRNGLGKMYYSNGEILTINFNDEQEGMNGIGTKTYKNGVIKQVEYENDELIREFDVVKS